MGILKAMGEVFAGKYAGDAQEELDKENKEKSPEENESKPMGLLARLESCGTRLNESYFNQPEKGNAYSDGGMGM